MLDITVTAYKDTGKYYTSCIIQQEENIQLYDISKLKNLLNGRIPFLKNGYIVIHDNKNGEGFHDHLFKTNDLLKN